MITFKKRKETKRIRIAYNPEYEDYTLKQIENIMRRTGEFNIGYHFILRKNGIMEKGLELDLYAHQHLPQANDTIYVLATTSKLTDAQSYALSQLGASLNLPIIKE